MRRGLAWVLGATVLLSIAALWGPQVPRLVASVEPRTGEAVASPDARESLVAPPWVSTAALPAELPQIEVVAAKRDPFIPYAPAPPPAPVAPRAPLPVPNVAAPPPPQAPPMNLRFLGSMVTPAGQRLVYLARGDESVLVAVGDRLDEGYVVNALTAEAVTLAYPPLELRVIVPISQPSGQ